MCNCLEVLFRKLSSVARDISSSLNLNDINLAISYINQLQILTETLKEILSDRNISIKEIVLLKEIYGSIGSIHSGQEFSSVIKDGRETLEIYFPEIIQIEEI
ncbi:MAG: hypothetical protein V1851_03200 [Patescibacteria group bacterium]